MTPQGRGVGDAHTFDEEAQLLVEAVDLISARLEAVQSQSTQRLELADERLTSTQRGLTEVEGMLERVAAHMALVPELVNGDLAPTAARLEQLQHQVQTLKSDPPLHQEQTLRSDPPPPARTPLRESAPAVNGQTPTPSVVPISPDDWVGEAPVVVPPHVYRWVVLAIVCVGVFMTTVDSGILEILNPVFVREFGLPLDIEYWIELAFGIPLVGMLLPSAYLAERVGRKKVFLGGMALFGAGSCLLTVLPEFWMMLGARALQGVGAACIQANGGVLAVQAFPWHKRGRTLGIVGSAVAIGLFTGPLIGGVLTEEYGWRTTFLVNVFISAAGVIVGLLLLKPSRGGAHRQFDLEGAVFFVLAVGLLLTVLNQGQRWGWASPTSLGFLAAAVMAAYCFVRASLLAPEPAIDLRLYKNRDFSVAVGVAFLSFLALTPIQQFLPYYLHFTLGQDVAATGIRYATVTALIALLQPFSGWFADTFGSRRITSTGLLIQGLGLCSLVFLPDAGEPAWLVISLAMIGLGVGLFRSPNTRVLFASVPRDRVGTAGGYQHLPRELAHSLGETTVIPILAAVVLASTASMHLEPTTVMPPATVQVPGAALDDDDEAGEEEEEEELDELFENSPVEAHMVGYRTLFGLAGVMVLTAAGISYLVRSRALELDTEVAIRAAARAAAAAAGGSDGPAPPPQPAVPPQRSG